MGLKNTNFSVLMSVYGNDKPEFVKTAIESVTLRQTLRPSEVVLVVDGPVPPDLETVIKDFAKSDSIIRPIWLSQNKGLGNALREGMQVACNNIVVRMDSDDISSPDRFEKQIKYMEKHPDVDVLSGQISEFIDSEENIVGKRFIPETHEKIGHMIKKRCPINHVAVCFLRDSVLRVGNYQDWFWNEDYYLWVRMYMAGCKFANLPDILVNVRVGKDMYARRGSWKYFKSEEGIQRIMLKNRMISFPLYCSNVAVRFVIQVVMPNSLRGIVFQKLFRKK